jgi:hypothetical protein
LFHIIFLKICFLFNLLVQPVTVVTSLRNLKTAKNIFPQESQIYPRYLLLKAYHNTSINTACNHYICIDRTSHILTKTSTSLNHTHNNMGNFGNVCFTLVIYVCKVFYFIFIVTFTLNKFIIIFTTELVTL